MQEIKEKIRQGIYEAKKENENELELDDVQAPILCIAKDRKIVHMMSSDFRLASVEKGYSVVAVEREKMTSKDIVALTLLIT